MRKILAFILSLAIVFAPVYSYAVLPIIATAASAAGRILVGAVVRKPTGTAMRQAFRPCISSFASAVSCVGAAASIYDALRDKGYTVEDNSTTNNIDIDIYKISDAHCDFKVGWGSDYLDYDTYYTNAIKYLDTKDEIYDYRADDTYHDKAQFKITDLEDRYSDTITDGWRSAGTTLLPTQYKATGSDSWKQSNLSPIVYYRCDPPSNKKIYISQSELNTIIDQSINNLTIDERKQLYKNIYNYDYSQHPSITINNNSTSGDSINNDIKNAPKEFEVSVELGDKINNNEVDMDDINPENCSIGLDGTYTDCGNSPEPEPEPEECPAGTQLVNANDCKPIDEENCPVDYNFDGQYCVKEDEPTEPQPLICGSTALTQKFCDWMDWTQKDPAKPVNTEVDIIDKSQDITLDKNRYRLNASCPAPHPYTITVFGKSKTMEFRYDSLCDFLAQSVGITEAVAYISSIFIITGIRPTSKEGN